jgi:hypothetical protein
MDSRVVLVLDKMPTCCRECRVFSLATDEKMCECMAGCWVNFREADTKRCDDCPLKPINAILQEDKK